VIKRDGTGPEVVDGTLKVLQAVDTDVNSVVWAAGSDWWQQHGGPSFSPPESWKIFVSADAYGSNGSLAKRHDRTNHET
jgi:isocitrate/isopropylmalate dehydrogenase